MAKTEPERKITGGTEESPCPCGSGRAYPACCGRLHNGAAAPDAEALMRSRYSAYVLRREDYLLASWHASTRPDSLDLLNEHPSPQWLGLEVKRHVPDATDPGRAVVEFVARYKVNGRAHRLHETSRFVFVQKDDRDGRWYYLDADG